MTRAIAETTFPGLRNPHEKVSEVGGKDPTEVELASHIWMTPNAECAVRIVMSRGPRTSKGVCSCYLPAASKYAARSGRFPLCILLSSASTIAPGPFRRDRGPGVNRGATCSSRIGRSTRPAFGPSFQRVSRSRNSTEPRGSASCPSEWQGSCAAPCPISPGSQPSRRSIFDSTSSGTEGRAFGS